MEQSHRILSPYSYINYYNKIAEQGSDNQGKNNKFLNNESISSLKDISLNPIQIPTFMQADHERKEFLRSRISQSKSSDSVFKDEEEVKIKQRMENLISKIAANNKNEKEIVFRAIPSQMTQSTNRIDFIDTSQKKFFSNSLLQKQEFNKRNLTAFSKSLGEVRNTFQDDIIISEEQNINQVNSNEEGISKKKNQIPQIKVIIQEIQKENRVGTKQVNSKEIVQQKYEHKLSQISKWKKPEFYLSQSTFKRSNLFLRKILASIPENKLQTIYEEKKNHIDYLCTKNNLITQQNSDGLKNQAILTHKSNKILNGISTNYPQNNTKQSQKSNQVNVTNPDVQQLQLRSLSIDFQQNQHSPKSTTSSQSWYNSNKDSQGFGGCKLFNPNCQGSKTEEHSRFRLRKSLKQISFSTKDIKETPNQVLSESQKLIYHPSKEQFKIKDKILLAFSNGYCLKTPNKKFPDPNSSSESIPSILNYTQYFKQRYLNKNGPSLNLSQNTNEINDLFQNEIRQSISQVQ